MKLWDEEIPADMLTAEEAAFLVPFVGRPKLTLDEIWHNLDAVWRGMNLDRHCSEAGLAAYYAHPVWLLNGIFTAIDPVSADHRRAIARWLADRGLRRIADFGGGGGQLARAIAEVSPAARVDIIEPYPSKLARHRTAACPNIRWLATFAGDYDAVIAQDVLEHVPDPIGTTVLLLSAVRQGGVGVFANCFYPVIQCHLPETFHLRHTFDAVVRPLGASFSERIGGAEHARVYIRNDQPLIPVAGLPRARRRETVARIVGPLLNAAFGAAAGLRRRFADSEGERA